MRGNITTSCRKVKSFKTYLKILRMRVKNRNMNRIITVVNWLKSKGFGRSARVFSLFSTLLKRVLCLEQSAVGIWRLSRSKSDMKCFLMEAASSLLGWLVPLPFGFSKPHMMHNFFKLASCERACWACEALPKGILPQRGDSFSLWLTLFFRDFFTNFWLSIDW